MCTDLYMAAQIGWGFISYNEIEKWEKLIIKGTMN